MRILMLLLVVTSPVLAAMDITREIIAPKSVVPGQPVTIAVTYWTDSWFEPPPEWPEFLVKNGVLLNTPLPNQLQTRQKNGLSWSGIRLERQMIAWGQNSLILPAVDVALTSANQLPTTVHLDELKQTVLWPEGVEQPDRFLPARNLTMTQTITQVHAGSDQTLRVGDTVERVVTVKAENVMPAQIPQLLYEIPGNHSQRLAPVNSFIRATRSINSFQGAMHQEYLRYLPAEAGSLTLPPVKLRWWDTEHHQWQLAALDGQVLKVNNARVAGKESGLRGRNAEQRWQTSIIVLTLLAIAGALGFARRPLHQCLRWGFYRWERFWNPVSLPELSPSHRKKR